MSRPWTRQYRRQTFRPTEIWIAGVDFECSADDPLRDEPSAARAADHDELLASLRNGFFGSILVTARPLPGHDHPVPVVVDGRRRIELSRVVNEDRAAEGLEPWTWAVEYVTDAGAYMFEIARRLNRGAVPETPAQTAVYLTRMLAQGATEEHAAATLGISPTMLGHYKAIAEPTTAPWIRKQLDAGVLSVLGAATLARLSPAEQARAQANLDGKDTVTTEDARAAAADAKGTRATIAPKKREIRRLLSSPAATKLDPLIVSTMRVMLGDVDLAEVPQLADAMASLRQHGIRE